MILAKFLLRFLVSIIETVSSLGLRLTTPTNKISTKASRHCFGVHNFG